MEEIDTILFPPNPSLAFGEDTSDDLIRELKRLRKKKTDLELHGQTLSEYYRAGKIPRGFRIRNQPTIGRHKPEFCTKWCEVSNQNSFNYMILVIEEVKIQLCQLNRELASLEISIKDKEVHTPGQPAILQAVETELQNYTDKLKKYKREKFKRVCLDYTEGKVYPWLTGQEDQIQYPFRKQARRQPFYRKPLRNTGRQPQGSDSDILSENRSSDSDIQSDPPRSDSTDTRPPPFQEASVNADPGGAAGRYVDTRRGSMGPRTRRGTRKAQ